jgi:hypothetical protein
MRPIAGGTCVRQPTFGRLIMDDKTLELWRQIETYRRRGKRRPPGESKLPSVAATSPGNE